MGFAQWSPTTSAQHCKHICENNAVKHAFLLVISSKVTSASITCLRERPLIRPLLALRADSMVQGEVNPLYHSNGPTGIQDQIVIVSSSTYRSVDTFNPAHLLVESCT